ncbi:hypothetical protein MNBD_NITROSPINAE04-1185 [hydrothermal vent metagenome]|uniref:Uncharacterized protein n=1 Tax=hydrothermal vent metagenome TaxID=652676 RepID=A0A3B1BT79_9ZZZZ
MAITPPANEAAPQQLSTNPDRTQNPLAKGLDNGEANSGVNRTGANNNSAATNQEAAIFHPNARIVEQENQPAETSNDTSSAPSREVTPPPEKRNAAVEEKKSTVVTDARDETVASAVDTATQDAQAPEENIAFTRQQEPNPPEKAVAREETETVENAVRAETEDPQARPAQQPVVVRETAPTPEPVEATTTQPAQQKESGAESTQRIQAEGQEKNRPVADQEIGGTVNITV